MLCFSVFSHKHSKLAFKVFSCFFDYELVVMIRTVMEHSNFFGVLYLRLQKLCAVTWVSNFASFNIHWVLFKISIKFLQSSCLCGYHHSNLSDHPYVLTKLHVIIYTSISHQDNAILRRLPSFRNYENYYYLIEKNNKS